MNYDIFGKRPGGKMNSFHKLLLLSAFLMSFQSSAFNESSERVKELVKNSQKTRLNIENKLTKRELASLEKNESKLAREFDKLMKEDEKANWFNEIDKIIE